MTADSSALFGEAGSPARSENTTPAVITARVMALAIDVLLVHFLYFSVFLLSCLAFWIVPIPDFLLFVPFFSFNVLFYFFTFPLFVMVYFSVLSAWSGQTIGKMFMGLRVETAAGGNLSLGQGFLRFAAFLLALLPVGLGLLWVFVDEGSRGWHDRIAVTRVVGLK
jgi:uncharacterized RDD family membrane protein YckC